MTQFEKRLHQDITNINWFIDDPYSIVCYLKEDYFHKYTYLQTTSDQEIYHHIKMTYRYMKISKLNNKIKNNKNNK